MKDGLVSIIIVTWNAERFIQDCLNTIKNQSYNRYEIIIVDNGSTDKTIELAEEFKNSFKSNLKIIKNNTNTGFCRANNIGLEQAIGEYVLFLNPDTRLDVNYLRNAFDGFKSDEIGAVSGRILRFDEQTIDSTGQSLAKNRRPVERGYNQLQKEEFLAPGFCFSVCGAAAFYRRLVVDELKISGQFFDEDYFAFYEDLDTGWRMNLYGYKCYYEPNAVLYHHRGGSNAQRKGFLKKYQITGRNSRIQIDIIKNRWLTILKNDNILNYLLDSPFIIIQEIKTFLYLFFLRPWLLPKVYYKYFRLIGSAFRKRRIINSKRKISSFEIRRRM